MPMIWKKVKKVLLSNDAKRFYWTVSGGFVAFASVWVTGLNLWWTPLAMAVLTGLTKIINKRCFPEEE
jgi:hypothetical protein